MSVQDKHGDEKFLYHIRGYIKNLNLVDGTATFNIDPQHLHCSGMNVDGTILPSITLIGGRVIKDEHGLRTQNRLLAVLSSAKFRCINAYRYPLEEGACRMFQIDEEEVQRIEPLVTNPNLVVNVKGILY